MTPLTARHFMTKALQIAHDAAESQGEAIRCAADAICDSLERGHRLWAFGSGHSHMMVEEIWGRAGGLANVSPILEPSLMLHEGLLKSSLLERHSGLAATILDIHGVVAGDALLIASNSGRNAVPVEMAIHAREIGVTVIALTSLTHSTAVSSRVASGKRLFEVADHIIDNRGVRGDAVVETEPYAVGATSTMVGAMLVQGLVVEIVGRMTERGKPLETLQSLNV